MGVKGLNRRTRNFLLAVAQLALVAYLFQVAALDHWRVDPGHDVLGIDGSAAHVAHCHGDSAGCADSSGSAATVSMDGIVRLPLPPAPQARESEVSDDIPVDAFLAALLQPPKAG